MALMFALLFAVLLSIYLILNVTEENLIRTIISFLLTMGIIISLLFILGTPKEKDVYEGNTTLVLKNKNGVTIDSTVVVASKKK